MLDARFMFEGFGEANTELMLAVAESPFGQALKNQIRYEQYCHIPEGTQVRFLPEDRRDEVVHTWSREWLDADVNNLEHNPFTALIGRSLCRLEGLDQQITDRVVRALLVHDLKEYIFDPHTDEGDISYDDAVARGHEGFRQEHLELGELLRTEYFAMLSDEAVEQIIADLDDSKRNPPETIYGQMIEMAERVGYMHSALAAHRLHNTNLEVQPAPEQVAKLYWMTENVIANQLGRIVEVAYERRSVAFVLEARSDHIAEALFEVSGTKKRTMFSRFYEEKGIDPNEREALLDKAGEAFIEYDMAA